MKIAGASRSDNSTQIHVHNGHMMDLPLFQV